MPASKHRRRGRTRPRWVPPPRPPHRPITEQDRARGRAARRASAPALRAAGYRPPGRRHRLELGAVQRGGCPARGRGRDPPRQRSGGLNRRFGPAAGRRAPPLDGTAAGSGQARFAFELQRCDDPDGSPGTVPSEHALCAIVQRSEGDADIADELLGHRLPRWSARSARRSCARSRRNSRRPRCRPAILADRAAELHRSPVCHVSTMRTHSGSRRRRLTQQRASGQSRAARSLADSTVIGDLAAGSRTAPQRSARRGAAASALVLTDLRVRTGPRRSLPASPVVALAVRIDQDRSPDGCRLRRRAASPRHRRALARAALSMPNDGVGAGEPGRRPGDKESRPAVSRDRRRVRQCCGRGEREPAAGIGYAGGGGSASPADQGGIRCSRTSCRPSNSSTAPACRRRSRSCSTSGPTSTPAPRA